ncbi:MAG: double-strand break repair protein AddB [Alphaproteobacteria bacterium]|nr:double-strand break repair protein AddB [Alphaproteobacteria bacterium]
MTGRPNVFTIPPGKVFVDALAAGLLRETDGEPFALSDIRVLLPTRRAVRSLREAFLRLSGGKPMLLPVMTPIGDVDEEDLQFHEGVFSESAAKLPPAIPELRRRLLLSELILHKGLGPGSGPGPLSPDQAAYLAVELARLLDRVETERLSFEGLAALVPADYAAHWQETLTFLRILTEHWPAILAGEGGIDPADRRNRLLEAQAAAWARIPPAGPVIAAGSTGSIPATADLLKVVANLAQGRLVLPGLDRHMDAESWEAMNFTHPQFGLKQLLEGLGVAREDVPDWPDGEAPAIPAARAAFVSELMRPAETTHRWHQSKLDFETALKDVLRVECQDPTEEAGVIALLLRRALEEKDTRAALVTPDRHLARRVAAELRRWQIEVDDSGGTPLDATPPGAFLRLVVRLAMEKAAPVALLACFKHPLASAGLDPVRFRKRIRQLERAVLRAPRPAPGFKGLRQALQGVGEEKKPGGLEAWLAAIEKMAKPFMDIMARRTARLGDLLEAHVAFAQALAATPEDKAGRRLWDGEAGEALANFIADLRPAARSFPPVDPAAYGALFDSLLAGHVLRPHLGQHPRLAILGPLEARLQHVDVMILGGLNEGTWPPEPEPDPWMSRPMRAQFGLPLPERRIGLSAHDFAQCLAAPRVVLTRASRVDGTPTVPSRWLLRMKSLAGAGETAEATDLLRWREFLHQPAAVRPVKPPEPRPPLEVRPRQLSVTAVETWMRDPYAIYAREVLKLKPLDPLDADPGAADRGRFIHAALDRFVRKYPDRLPADAFDRLLDIGWEAFRDAHAYPGIIAFWWPRFERIADWFLAMERDRRSRILGSATEVKGAVTLSGPGGDFTLTATADRIDRLATGGLAVIDYKTGGLPARWEMETGLAPQLALEAVIAEAGGFRDVPAERVEELLYIQLVGGAIGGEEKPWKRSDPHDLAAEAKAGLERLIAAFDDPKTPYRSEPRPEARPSHSDYAHLARVEEWIGTREGGAS